MISTHVLDTARGVPAAGVRILLERLESSRATAAGREISRTATDAEGRVRELLPEGTVVDTGRYRLTFDTSSYYATLGVETFYPFVVVAFEVHDATQHHHVPLLLSPYGYSTYRGS
jgi:5-hydroxyisourate hydrolase